MTFSLDSWRKTVSEFLNLPVHVHTYPRKPAITECSSLCSLVSCLWHYVGFFRFIQWSIVHWFMQSGNECICGRWFSHFSVPPPKRIYFRWAWDEPSSRNPKVNKQERSGSWLFVQLKYYSERLSYCLIVFLLLYWSIFICSGTQRIDCIGSSRVGVVHSFKGNDLKKSNNILPGSAFTNDTIKGCLI